MKSPVVLFIRHLKSGSFWYSRFLNAETGKYEVTRSTGIEVKGKNSRNKAYSVAVSMLDSIQFNDSSHLIHYVKAFWKPDSKYARFKALVEGKPLSKNYLNVNNIGIRLYVETYEPFHNLKMDDLTPAMIEDYKLHLVEMGVGKRRINTVLQALSVPFNYALSRDEVKSNPFHRVKKIAYQERERGVLSPDEYEKLLDTEEGDLRVKASILLASRCGLRRGECRGLRWGQIDFKKKIITVENNYVDGEGDKPCKTGSDRETILHSSIIPALLELKADTPYPMPNDYVLYSTHGIDLPVSSTVIKKGFHRVLRNIGISEDMQRERNLTFHGLRHGFVSMARMAGLPDMAVQALVGHKTSRMMDRYSHGAAVLDFTKARKKLEEAAV